jgi:hypothetical protein
MIDISLSRSDPPGSPSVMCGAGSRTARWGGGLKRVSKAVPTPRVLRGRKTGSLSQETGRMPRTSRFEAIGENGGCQHVSENA